MQAIQLSERQKKRLLKMAVKLFPQNFFDEEGEDYYINEQGMVNFLRKIKKNTYTGVEIHWLEFCLNEVLLAIYQVQNGTFGISDAHEKAYKKELGHIMYNIYETNPVDYLYKQFKQLGI